MNSTLKFLAILIISSISSAYVSDIEVRFIEAIRSPHVSNRVILKFEIKNHTNDTVCISDDYLKIKITNQGRVLNEEIPIDLPFISLEDNDASIPITQSHEIFKKKFATKVYNQNYSSDVKTQEEKKWIVRGIVNKVIVLLPNRSTVFQRVFYNSEFSSESVVKVNYVNNGIFCTYMNEHDEEEQIILKE